MGGRIILGGVVETLSLLIAVYGWFYWTRVHGARMSLGFDLPLILTMLLRIGIFLFFAMAGILVSLTSQAFL